MIVDSSALIAILAKEPEWMRLNEVMGTSKSIRLSVANYLEVMMVLSGRTLREAALEEMMVSFNIEQVPVSLEQGRLAIEAFRKFGKGRHPARLNYGDCFAYALAREQGEPLLFKGGDFDKTDVAVAAY